jgi:hypothetical protein
MMTCHLFLTVKFCVLNFAGQMRFCGVKPSSFSTFDIAFHLGCSDRQCLSLKLVMEVLIPHPGAFDARESDD